MQEHYEEIRRLSGEVLVVSFSPPERLADHLKTHPYPFPVVADPTLAAYHAFTLGRTSWKALLGLRVMARFLKMMLRGWLPEKPKGNDDIYQLGGNFILDRQRRLLYVHRSVDPTDRPPATELIQRMKEEG